jgi:uncharacterized phiE125 gp8 family phage protein
MSLKIITAPVAEPITTAEAKAHLHVTGSDDDTYIAALIVSAREGAEHLTGRALMTQTLELALDEFERTIKLPRPPLATITSVKYLDQSGVLQTMAEASYLLDSHSEPAALLPAYGASWPAVRCQKNTVLVRYQAGYASAALVPQMIKSWMLLRIGMLYENRESVVAGAPIAEIPHVDRLLDPYRFWGF